MAASHTCCCSSSSSSWACLHSFLFFSFRFRYNDWAIVAGIPVDPLHGWWDWVSKGGKAAALPASTGILAVGMALARCFLNKHRAAWQYRTAQYVLCDLNVRSIFYCVRSVLTI